MPGRPPNPQRDKIRAMYAAGHRKIDIAEALGITQKAVSWNTQDMEPASFRMDRTLNGAKISRIGIKRGNMDQLSQTTLEWLVSNTRGNDTIMQTFDRIIREHHAA